MLMPRALAKFGHLAAVFYLCAAGWFFVLSPWSAIWALRVVPLAPVWLIGVLDSPMLRGVLSGFGVLHFAYAASWLQAELAKS